MTENEMVTLMEASQTEAEWNDNCDKVKAANGGNYPHYWFRRILQSGLMRRVVARWGGDDQIRIVKVG